MEKCNSELARKELGDRWRYGGGSKADGMGSCFGVLGSACPGAEDSGDGDLRSNVRKLRAGVR
eukprot:5298241-Pleurochrysis_carterae.AAC.1